MIAVPRSLRLWGLIGALVAAAFSIWMFFFPQYIPAQFAWDVQPRMAQAFIGAGYLYRTYFFLLFVFVQDYRKLRWAYIGNLFFTGALLLATLWHAQEMHWLTIAAHLWIVFYTLEPVIMHFSVPRGQAAEPLQTGGPILPWFRRFLILEVAIGMLFGALLIINPEWLGRRWPWDLNPFDARIVAAWWVGWAAWAAAIAQARDWDEVKLAVIGNLILAAGLVAVSFIFYPHFNHSHPTVTQYIIGTIVLTVGLAFFTWRQERARPRVVAAPDAPALVTP
jgi:hypothetical protein